MLQIDRIDHIGQVVPELDGHVALLERLFGFRRLQESENAERAFRGVSLEVPGKTGIRWEVLAPTSSSSLLQEFLDSPRGPGIHHIAIQVPDAAASLQELQQVGIEPDQRSDGLFDVRIDPQRPPQGLLFRLFGRDAGASCLGDGTPVGVSEAANAAELGIVALDHVCHAYRDRDELARYYERLLGMREVYRTPDGEHEDLADLVMDVPGTDLKWEVIQPVGEDSFIEKFLSTRGPSPHHVTFEVADWDRAVAACEGHEVPMFDENQGETDGAKWRDAFIHPKHTGGMLVQVFWEEQPGVWVRSDKIPSGS